MRTRYGTSPWIDLFPGSRRPDYPRFRGERAADVVIVGGGLTGCATAYACAAAGLDTVLLERDRIAQGDAGRSVGLLTPEPGPAFRNVAAAHGVRAARRVFEAWRRGSLDAAALLRRLNIKCALDPRELVVAARAEDEKRLLKEYEARRQAGLDLTWLNRKAIQRSMGIEAAAGVRVRDSFTLDPYRAAVGLAAAARRKGTVCFERSRVRKVRFTRKDAEVVAEGGTIRAQHVVVATGSATAEFKALQRHFRRCETYLALTEPVPAAVRRQLGPRGTVLRDLRVPPRALTWTPDNRLLVAGADQPPTPAAKRQRVLVQRTGQLMYELLTTYPAISGLQPAYGWEASYAETADGLMYIGAHRNYPHHLFALGGSRDSVTGAFVAARILVRALQGTPDKADEAFAWTR